MKSYFIQNLAFCGIFFALSATAFAQTQPAAQPAQVKQAVQTTPVQTQVKPTAQTKEASAPAQTQAKPAAQAQVAPAQATAPVQAAASTQTQAQAKAITLADAQKAYVAGKWKEAASDYEQVCKTQPEEKRPECYLWNILALSQTGNAADFTKAGKRLDSLIQVVNPQKAIYADLMMTRAQFLLYLGKYDNSADALVHAIETSKPEQNAVLQKVCTAIQAKITKDNLTDACNRLKTDPQNLASISEQKNQATPPQDLELPDFDTPTSTKPQSQPKATESTLWALQMGAFSMKANAETLCNNLRKRKILCNIAELDQDSRTLFLVQTQTFKTREEAVEYGTKTLAPINIDYRPVVKK